MKKIKNNEPISILKLVTITPKKYNNSYLFKKIEENRVNILYVQINSIQIIGNNLYFTSTILTSGESIKSVIFRYKKYHLDLFTQFKTLYIKGKVVRHDSFGLQIINPIKIEKPLNEILPIYKKKEIGDAIIENINYENLKKQGLPYTIIESLLNLHRYPTDEIINSLEKDGEFSKDIIYALKFTEAFQYIRSVKNSVLDYEPIQKLSGNVEDWIKTLPFKLTGDQKKTILDIKNDVTQNIAMRRVVVGDVGSGKTIIILASIVLAYPHKSILMAPTAILAKQLFEEAKKFLPEHFKILLLTSKTSKNIFLDNFDIIIGTSAILHKKLPQTAIIIIDEQHRFGTKDRNKLEKLAQQDLKRPHFIQLSATPIPRTQAMINSTFIKTSLIEDIPFKKDIDTEIIFSNDFSNLLLKIRAEIQKNNQILIIYPLVTKSVKVNYQSIDESESYWKKNFDNVYITHGKDKNKESVLEEFKDDGNILLATTVVEVGISLPRLTVVIIVGAERLGLATLHQLRGRVSRTGLKGYCFLYTKNKETKTIERLNKFKNTKSGFDIASIDLENRKGGDIIKGLKQSGETFNWFNIAKDKKIVEDVLDII